MVVSFIAIGDWDCGDYIDKRVGDVMINIDYVAIDGQKACAPQVMFDGLRAV